MSSWLLGSLTVSSRLGSLSNRPTRTVDRTTAARTAGGVAAAHLPLGTDARGDGGLPRTPPPPSPDGPLLYTLRHLY